MKNVKFKRLEKLNSKKTRYYMEHTTPDVLFRFLGNKDIYVCKSTWDENIAVNMRTGECLERIPDDTPIIFLDVKYKIEIIKEY